MFCKLIKARCNIILRFLIVLCDLKHDLNSIFSYSLTMVNTGNSAGIIHSRKKCVQLEHIATGMKRITDSTRQAANQQLSPLLKHLKITLEDKKQWKNRIFFQ